MECTLFPNTIISLIILNHSLKTTRTARVDAFRRCIDRIRWKHVKIEWGESVETSDAMTVTHSVHLANYQSVRVRGSGHPFRFPRLCEHGKDKSIRTNPPGATVATHSVHNEEKRHGTSCRQRRGVIYVLSCIDNKVAFNQSKCILKPLS